MPLEQLPFVLAAGAVGDGETASESDFLVVTQLHLLVEYAPPALQIVALGVLVEYSESNDITIDAPAAQATASGSVAAISPLDDVTISAPAAQADAAVPDAGVFADTEDDATIVVFGESAQATADAFGGGFVEIAIAIDVPAAQADAAGSSTITYFASVEIAAPAAQATARAVTPADVRVVRTLRDIMWIAE